MEQKYLWEEEKEIDLFDMLVEPFRHLKSLLLISAGAGVLWSVCRVLLVKTKEVPTWTGIAASFAKNLILGFVCAALLLFFFWCVAYALDRTVKTAGELQEGIGLLQLGNICLRQWGKGEKFARRLLFGKKNYSAEEETAVLCSRILAICKKQEIREIVLGGKSTEKSNEYLQKVIAELTEKGLRVQLCEDFSRSADGLEATAKRQEDLYLILLVTVRGDTYQKVTEELRFCAWQDAKLLGYVALEA